MDDEAFKRMVINLEELVADASAFGRVYGPKTIEIIVTTDDGDVLTTTLEFEKVKK